MELKQTAQMLEAAKPLMKFLAANCHPHCVAVVDSHNIELLEGIAFANIDVDPLGENNDPE